MPARLIGRFVLRSAVLFVLLRSISSGAAEVGAWIDLQEIENDFELRRMTLEGGGDVGMRLFSLGRQIDLELGSQVAKVNGVRIHLAQPLRLEGNRTVLLRLDWETAIRPLLSLAGQNLETLRPPVHIWIDPGHGGKDGGAENTTLGLLEKNLTLGVALLLEKRLLERGYTVDFTRRDDRFIPLAERSLMANAGGADLFLSIHFNAWYDDKVAGVETFVLPPATLPSTDAGSGDSAGEAFAGNRFDTLNTLFAYHLQRNLLLGTEDLDRGVKRAKFAVLKNLDCPGALVELGFLTHPESGARFLSPNGLDRLARILAEGIDQYAGEVRRATGAAAENPVGSSR